MTDERPVLPLTPGWVVRDGLLECRADGTLLVVRGPVGAKTLALWCRGCSKSFWLRPEDISLIGLALEDTRKAAYD